MLLKLFPELVVITSCLRLISVGPAQVVSVLLFAFIIKHLILECIGPNPLIMRPKDARDCDSFKYGICDDQPGLPSVHATLAGYLMPLHINSLADMIIIVYLFTVAFSRVCVGCHTDVQVIVGLLLGAALKTFSFSMTPSKKSCYN